MHTNAGGVTALQQAVAHLSSALETLTNTDINMLMWECRKMDAWVHVSMLIILSVQPQGEVFFFYVTAGVIWTKAARLSEVSKRVWTQRCLIKQVNTLWWTDVNTFYTIQGLNQPLQRGQEAPNVWFVGKCWRKQRQCSGLMCVVQWWI